MTKSFFKKTEPITECLYNSQTGAIAFLCAFIFKISTIMAIIARSLESSTLWGCIVLIILEMICLRFMYSFFRGGTDDLTSVKKSLSYRVGLIVLLALLLFKAIIYISYTVLYITAELFTGVSSDLVLVIFLSCVVYITSKGIRSIGRLCELVIIPVFLIVMLNIVFLKTEMDFGNNFPIFSKEPAQIFFDIPTYGAWIGDLFPLIFIRQRNKKMPYFGIGVTACWGLLLVVVALGVAMYGSAFPYVSSLLTRLSGFNQLSLEIGRMDWTAHLISIVMAIIQIAFLLWGAEECSHRIFGSKYYVRVLYLVAIFAIAIFTPSAQSVADFGIEKPVGYTCLAIVLLLSIYFYFLKVRANKVFLRNGGEYVRIPQAEIKESKNEA